MEFYRWALHQDLTIENHSGWLTALIIHYDSSIEISGGKLLRKATAKINQFNYLVEVGQEKQPLRFLNQDN